MSLQGTVTPDANEGIAKLEITWSSTIDEADRIIETDGSADKIVETDGSADRIIEID